MHERFGSFLGDGEAANRLRMDEVLPALDECEGIVFDFAGVENMTHSFANACIANLIIDRGTEAKAKLRFINCSDVVKLFLKAALDLGLAHSGQPAISH